MNNELTGLKRFLSFVKTDILAILGFIGIFGMIFIAVFAPILANGRPLLLYMTDSLSSPALYFIFAPDGSEIFVEKFFNYLFLFFPMLLIIKFLPRKIFKYKKTIILILGIILIIPFLIFSKRLDKTDWRKKCANLQNNEFAIFAPVKYAPSENVASPYEQSSINHWLGTDQIGRDLLSRIIYGARVSLAVGFFATGISMLIGILVGLISGYYAGKTDMILMRIVEIIICFPTFLLLLILMSIMMDYKFNQSILIVIVVIGFTSWTGLARLVRGEVLKQRILPYIQSCKTLAIPTWRIMLYHILPNITAPILVSFTFGVAGAIGAESSLSFLGFGVQEPTASWGELLRQAFADPFTYIHLTIYPGFIIFITVSSFNFTGEALHKFFDPKS